MNYTTYWSILDTPSVSTKSNSICLVVAVAFGLLWLLIKRFKKDNKEGDKAILLWAAGVFSIIGLSFYIAFTFSYKDNSEARLFKILDLPTTPKVVGVISNFQRELRNTRYGTETIESFTVDSVRFKYGDVALAKFNSFSKTYNHVIFDGQKVRITYKTGSPYGDNFNSILRIEVDR